MKKVNDFFNEEEKRCLICGNVKNKQLSPERCIVCGNEFGFSKEKFTILKVGDVISVENISKRKFLVKMNADIQLPDKTLEFMLLNSCNSEAELWVEIESFESNKMLLKQFYVVFCGNKSEAILNSENVIGEIFYNIDKALSKEDILKLLGIGEDESLEDDEFCRFEDDLDFDSIDFDELDWSKEDELLDLCFNPTSINEIQKQLGKEYRLAEMSDALLRDAMFKFLEKINKHSIMDRVDELTDERKIALFRLARDTVREVIDKEALNKMKEVLDDWNINYKFYGVSEERDVEEKILVMQMSINSFAPRSIISILGKNNDEILFILPNGVDNYIVFFDKELIRKYADYNFIKNSPDKQLGIKGVVKLIFEILEKEFTLNKDFISSELSKFSDEDLLNELLRRVKNKK